MNFTLPKEQPARRAYRKKTLYQLLLARSDMAAALEALRLFRDHVDRIGHPLYYPLFASIVVCYARPFTKNEPLGPLPKRWSKFNHPKAQETHDDLIKARHQFVAHSDVAARTAMIVPRGFVIARDKGKEISSEFVAAQIFMEYFPPAYFHMNVWNVVNDLMARLSEEIEPMLEDLYGGRMELPARPFKIRFLDDGL